MRWHTSSWRFATVACVVLQSLALQCCFAEKVLVLLSHDGMRASHSELLADLGKAGVELETRLITDSKLQIMSWSRWLYDGVVILSKGSPGFGGAVDAAQLVDFVDAGGSLFVATDERPSDSLRHVAAQLGADYVQQASAVEDHVGHDAAHGETHLLTRALYPSAVMTGAPKDPILYKGGAFTTSKDSALVYRVVSPEPTATVTSLGSILSGLDAALVVAMQSRTNARFCAVASVDALSDAFFDAKVQHAASGLEGGTGNRVLATALLRWTLKLQGVLKHEAPQHHRVGQQAPPAHSTYTVNDSITLEVRVLERQGSSWVPHQSDSLVAQYVMLDPFVRQPMAHEGDGRYSLTIRAPDVYGVFKWVVDYKRPGYTFLHFEEVMPLRPLRHDQYPRFLVQAYPYYFTLMSVSVAFFVTIAATLFSK
jgi:oligosaccharyltransferase complex subunit beta